MWAVIIGVVLVLNIFGVALCLAAARGDSVRNGSSTAPGTATVPSNATARNRRPALENLA